MENKNSLRWELNQSSTQQLAQMLQQETQKDVPDDDLVLLILHILEERDADKPIELGPKSRSAWETYCKEAEGRTKSPVLWLKRAAKMAASLVLILGMLFVIAPQEASAGSFWKIFTNVTDSIFQYVNIGSRETQPEEYVFQSDNPGLQQVYDAVVKELGITAPMVPQWLPEGSELDTIETIDTPAKKGIHARFKNDNSEIILVFDSMKLDLSPQYDKASQQIKEYEFKGIVHNYMRNKHVWTINWATQNIKCTLYIDCQEEYIKQIIQSIY